MNNASQVSQPLQTENAFAPEEDTSTATSNVSHVSETVPFVQVKPTVLCATLDCSFKTQDVLPDATSDSTSQASFVKNVKMDALTAKELELVWFVKLADSPTTDCVMSTAQLALLPNPPT